MVYTSSESVVLRAHHSLVQYTYTELKVAECLYTVQISTHLGELHISTPCLNATASETQQHLLGSHWRLARGVIVQLAGMQ